MTSDYERFYKDIVINKEYDFGIPEGDNLVVVDVGGHHGIFANYISPRSKAVYSIEPENSNFEKLKENTKDKPNIKVFNLAVCDNNEIRDLYLKMTDGDNSLVYTADRMQKIQGITLAKFVKDNVEGNIDLLKMDIEGGETLVFGSSDFGEIAQRIKNIVGEVHACSVKDKLMSHGFECEEKNAHFKAWRRNE